MDEILRKLRRVAVASNAPEDIWRYAEYLGRFGIGPTPPRVSLLPAVSWDDLQYGYLWENISGTGSLSGFASFEYRDLRAREYSIPREGGELLARPITLVEATRLIYSMQGLEEELAPLIQELEGLAAQGIPIAVEW